MRVGGGCLQICLGTMVSFPRCFSIRQRGGLEKKSETRESKKSQKNLNLTKEERTANNSRMSYYVRDDRGAK